MRRGLGAVAVFVVVAVGCGQASGQGSGPRHRGAAAPGTMVSGGTASQQSAVESILTGLGSNNQISEIKITASGPSDFATSSDSWVDFTIPTGRGPETIRAQWMAFLVAGAFRDMSAQSSTLPPVGGVILDGYGAQIIGGSDHPAITVTAPNDQTIDSNLQAIGLSPVSISHAQPDSGIAPIVIAQTSDPASFVAKHPNPWADVFGDVNLYEGTYLEVDDPQGQPVLIGAYASRAAHGVSWIRPDLATSISSDVHTS